MKTNQYSQYSRVRDRKRALRAPAGVLHRTIAQSHNRTAAEGVPLSKRTRGTRDLALPFVPPENWYESQGSQPDYRFVVQQPGAGFRHVLTPADVRERLAQLPDHFLAGLEVVQFSRMTRKKQSFPCYGLQWGTTLYLYPIETSLVERYNLPPKPNQVNEARMYGGRWMQEGPSTWKLVWTEAAIRDFYLNNILIHELGHLLDNRNSRATDRERYAEWFVLKYGYPHSQARAKRRPQTTRRHHARIAS